MVRRFWSCGMAAPPALLAHMRPRRGTARIRAGGRTAQLPPMDGKRKDRDHDEGRLAACASARRVSRSSRREFRCRVMRRALSSTSQTPSESAAMMRSSRHRWGCDRLRRRRLAKARAAQTLAGLPSPRRSMSMSMSMSIVLHVLPAVARAVRTSVSRIAVRASVVVFMSCPPLLSPPPRHGAASGVKEGWEAQAPLAR